jgi:hypothetical protein
MLADVYARILADCIYWLDVGYVFALGVLVIGFMIAAVVEEDT